VSFELRDHTADVGVAAEGGTLGETFAAVAAGLTAGMCEAVPETGGERTTLTVRAESREALLFDYLDELIYRRDAHSVLPVDHEATVRSDAEWVLIGSYRAIPLSDVIAREIKAVTYSDMRVNRTDNGWAAYVVFDV
jgi:SHS2 domain-containing protein